MENYLPSDIIYRPKSGFGVPLRKWIKGKLEDWLLEILSKDRINSRGIFNSEAVNKLIKKNKSVEIDASYTLFSIACIKIWCEKYL